MRLQKYMAMCGVAARRKCEEIIAAGRVAVNGETITQMGTQVEDGDVVMLDGQIITPEEEKRYILYHKPAGEVTTTQADAANTLRTDEELVKVLYAALGTLEYQGQINELEARRLHSLLSAMHRRWINTGCWKPYGAAEEQDEKERRKSQDVNS